MTTAVPSVLAGVWVGVMTAYTVLDICFEIMCI